MTKFHDCGNHAFTRRHFLFGAASAAQYFALARRAEAQTSSGAAPRGSASACIFINLRGGAAHLDTFDAKEGPWNPPGVNLTQHPSGLVMSQLLFPNLSRIASDMLVLRSVSAWEVGHERAEFYLQTGRALNPSFAAEIPHVGAIVASERGRTEAPLPPFLAFDNPGIKGASFLGGRFEPFMPGANANGLSLLSPAFFSSQTEFDQRNALLTALDAQRRNPASDDMRTYADFFGAARRMMFDPNVANVFRFTIDENQRYGTTSLGRSLLVARNAVRARNGVTFISASQDGWDGHFLAFDRTQNGNNYYRLTRDLDIAVFNLITDLRGSGDLDRTLIVLMGEFGRTPGPLNPRGGRDHYREAMSVAMIGGGVRRGATIGRTNSDGSLITDPGWSAQRPIYPEDIMATIYSALGIDWTKSVVSTSNRRWQYVTGAADGLYKPVNEVFA